jgi:CHAT domain-containing protein/Tfp pilus assembly protein PilF
MLSKFGLVGVLLLLPLMALAQSVQQQIRTQAELASALCRVQGTEQSRDALLTTHPLLIDSRLWEDVTRRAVAAYYQESPERAVGIYEVSKQVANKLRDPKLLAKTYYNLARTFSGMNQPEKAIASYERSRAYFEQVGLKRDLIYVLADIGAIYFNKEDYQKAKEYSDQSILMADSAKSSNVPIGSYPDDFGRARSLHTLAEIDRRSGTHEDAIEKLQRALALYQQLNGQGSNYHFYIAGVYAALGKVYPETGDYTKALFYLNKALDIAKVSGHQDTIANILNSIGFLYMEQEDYAQAKEHFDRSLKIYLAENDQREASRLFLNLGVLEQRQAHYEEALKQFNFSLQAAKATQITDVQIAAGEGIGVVLTAKKDFARALEILNESLNLARRTANKTREIELLWRVAQAHLDMGSPAEAGLLAENAVTLARTIRLPKLRYLATTTLALSYAAQQKPGLAIQTLRQAVEQLEALRDQVAGSEVESQLFLENKVGSYHALVDLLIQQGQTLDALLVAERAKGRILLDVFNSGRRDLRKLLTSSEEEETQRLNRKISEINARLKSHMDSTALDSLYRELDAARFEFQSFQDALYVARPDVRIRSGRTSLLTSADLKHLSHNNHAYLEYVTTKEQIFLFVSTRPSASGDINLKVYSIGTKPEDLARKVDLLHQRLADRSPDFTSLAHDLYVALIEPAERQLKGMDTICIVPDGFLWNLPFQALLSTDERYLLEEHALFYAPSLSVLSEMTKRSNGYSNRTASLIAFGNPLLTAGQPDDRDCPLPEAEVEVTAIARSFAKLNAKKFIGLEAREKTFKTLAPSYSFVHLATHGVIDNRHPLYSHLLLTSTEGDIDNDGRLEAREIMSLTLNADLAVLSACETANGRIAPGEGVMGMSWSFFVAGTRSLVVSQWKVNSESTSQFMSSFYQSLRSRPSSPQTKASALRSAALLTMKNSHYRHPFYWAPYVLIGTN